MVNEDSKVCPFCAETIKAAAIVCRYCSRDLTATPVHEDDRDHEFDRRVDEEPARPEQPRPWRIRGIKDGKAVSGTITAATAEAARIVAARHLERVTSVEQA